MGDMVFCDGYGAKGSGGAVPLLSDERRQELTDQKARAGRNNLRFGRRRTVEEFLGETVEIVRV